MADDNNSQNRLSNSSGRRPATSEQSSDPLAELARLIGQNDPFSEFGRQSRAPAPAHQEPMPGEQHMVSQPYVEAHEQPDAASSYQSDQDASAYSQATRDSGGYRDSFYRDGNQMPHSGDIYDDAEPSGRSRGFITVMVLVGLAVVGTAGAFGYRFMFSRASMNVTPTVIRANPEPVKAPPPVVSNESSSSKLTYDRVGDRSQGERVIVREEQPVDRKDLARQGASRSQPPSMSGAANSLANTSAPNLPLGTSTTSAAAPSPATLGEPKKVRTIPIRPDQSDAGVNPPTLAPPGAAVRPPGTMAAITPTNTSAARSAPVVQPAAPPVRAELSRPPAAAAQPITAPANSPLALGDESSPTPALPRMASAPRSVPAPQAATAPPQPAPPTRLAAAPPNQAAATVPRPTAPTPNPTTTSTRVATAPSGGGYLVQVSSQHNEAEAQASFRSLQAKYPSVLGGRQMVIRRADLGERGVFFRAMVGPFANRDQANQLCTSLKTAGGDCIVQSN